MCPEQGPEGIWEGTRQPPAGLLSTKGECLEVLALPALDGPAKLWVDSGHQQLPVKWHSPKRILAHCGQECHRQEMKCEESQEGEKYLVQLSLTALVAEGLSYG